MELANQLARRAADLEAQRKWDEAAETHERAAEAYKRVDIFAFDPVATLTLSSLTNRHMRWAESCRREGDRHDRNESIGTHELNSLPGDSSGQPPAAARSPDANADTDKGDSDKNEGEFEDFWQYMQNWLANPTAFTRPTVMPGSHGVEASPSTHGIMESFYLVGSNPDQSASIHTTAATTPKAASPLPVINEDEELPASPSGNDKLAIENQRLAKLAQHLNERIRTLESAAHENSMLKSSIFNFREEFHRHANVVSLPRFHEAGPGSRREPRATADSAASDAQIRQLELEVQRLELENSKQKAQVTKYRERWERLKESAKRKRQQQEQVASSRAQNP